jgi:hypothetical protein
VKLVAKVQVSQYNGENAAGINDIIVNKYNVVDLDSEIEFIMLP